MLHRLSWPLRNTSTHATLFTGVFFPLLFPLSLLFFLVLIRTDG